VNGEEALAVLRARFSEGLRMVDGTCSEQELNDALNVLFSGMTGLAQCLDLIAAGEGTPGLSVEALSVALSDAIRSRIGVEPLYLCYAPGAEVEEPIALRMARFEQAAAR